MDAVEDFIYHYEGDQREIMLILHQFLVSDYDLRSRMSYKIPFYYRKSWICYLNPLKGEGIELAFPRGHELSNEQGLLEARGRKMVMGIIILKPAEIPFEALNEILQESIVLDEKIPYKFHIKRGRQ